MLSIAALFARSGAAIRNGSCRSRISWRALNASGACIPIDDLGAGDWQAIFCAASHSERMRKLAP